MPGSRALAIFIICAAIGIFALDRVVKHRDARNTHPSKGSPRYE